MGIKKLFENVRKGNYPPAYVLYKLFTHNRIISKCFPQKLYSRLLERNVSGFDGAVRLSIPTYDGLGQTVHPSVVKIEDQYILAITPFPYGNDYYENPCIYISEDGVHFFEIYGMNPVVLPKNHEKLIYLSDPFLYLRDGQTHLIYRECEYITQTEYVSNIYEMISKDLHSWSEPKLVLSSRYGEMSPAVLDIKGQILFYSVQFNDRSTQLVRRVYNYPFVEEYCEFISIEGIPDKEMIWHIDFFKKDETLWGLFTTATDYFGSNAKLYLAKGIDDGTKWYIKRRIEIGDDTLFTKTYKACAVVDEGRVDLYVSARQKDRCWMTYLLSNFIVE